jgi:hypothetical protein
MTFAFTHPGETNYRERPQILEELRGVGPLYGEYHLHDRDRNPIRIGQKEKTEKPIKPAPLPAISLQEHPAVQEPASLAQSPAVPDQPRDASIVQREHYSVVFQEESIFPPYSRLLFVAAMLLLLALIIVRRKRR